MLDARLVYGAAAEALPAPPGAGPTPKSCAQAAAPFVAELVGSFALVFTIGCCDLSIGDPAWNPIAVGLVFMSMVYAIGPVSGGHLNPAVSLALCLVGQCAWPVMLGYWIMQAAGGIAAGFCVCALFTPRKAYIQPGAPFSWEYSVTAEFIFTALLCFVVLNCTAARRSNPRDDANQFYGLAIGSAVVTAGYAAGGISGACVNPAVAVGIDVASTPAGATGWSLCWTLAEFVGAVAAAILYRLVRQEEFHATGDIQGFSLAASATAVGFESGLAAKCLSEFLGTFVLVLSVGLAVVVGSLGVPWAAGSSLTCMVYSLSNVSGAHFNPAVTLAMTLRSRCSVRDGLAAVASQLAAAVLAGLTVGCFHAAGPRDTTIQLGPRMGYSPATAGFEELLFTLVLAYTVLACGSVAAPATWQTKQNNYSGFAIGSCAAVGGFACGTISGGALNPALCLGLATSSLYYHGAVAPRAPLTNCMAFSAWELAGGLMAAALFKKTHPGEFRDRPLLIK